MKIVWIGIGGFLGAVLRYWVDGLVMERVDTSFPLGTMVVNLSGSILLGVFFALALERFAIGDNYRYLIAIGIIGAYTTFSTFMLESYKMMETGNYLFVFINLFGSVLLGLIAFYSGLVIGRLV